MQVMQVWRQQGGRAFATSMISLTHMTVMTFATLTMHMTVVILTRLATHNNFHDIYDICETCDTGLICDIYL